MNSRISRRRFFSWCTLFAGALSASRLEAAPEETHLPEKGWPTLGGEFYPEPSQISGVAVARDGNILALTHGDNHSEPQKGFRRELIRRPVVLVIEPKSGKIIRAWGNNIFTLPHQITVDAAGHVWIVDGGAKSVFKFDANGEKMLELTPGEAGFTLPTDVAVLSDGSFIVADGALNKRGVKFDASGQSLGDWGLRGSGPMQLHSPHSLAVDEDDRVYVGDRENHWVQVFTPEGELLATWRKVGGPLTVRYHAGSVYVLSNLSGPRGIVRRFSKQGELLESFHTKPHGATGDFEWPHGLAVSDGGDSIYVGFVLSARRIQRYRRTKITAK